MGTNLLTESKRQTRCYLQFNENMSEARNEFKSVIVFGM